MEAAFINLLSNARDAMEDGGTLTITTRDLRIGPDAEDLQPAPGPGEYVLVEVADTGMGIPEAVIDKIFDPFFTTKPSGKGSGLGLSMVFGFMKQSGGHVSVQSRPGAGTVFNLYLPRSLHCGPETVEASAGSAEPDPTGHLETILVVDDNARLRRATVRQLVHLGYHVLEAQDAMTARAILDTDNTVSLLFSDVAMPGGHGRDRAGGVDRRAPACVAKSFDVRLLGLGKPRAATRRHGVQVPSQTGQPP